MIGRNGERRSGISAQAARHDDDDDVCILRRTRAQIKIYNFISTRLESLIFDSSCCGKNIFLTSKPCSVFSFCVPTLGPHQQYYSSI